MLDFVSKCVAHERWRVGAHEETVSEEQGEQGEQSRGAPGFVVELEHFVQFFLHRISLGLDLRAVL